MFAAADVRILRESWLDDLGSVPSEKYGVRACLDSPPSTFEIQVRGRKKKKRNFESGNKRVK